MRTTLTFDEDVAQQLADLARESGRPFKVLVNEAIRRGLSDQAHSEPPFQIHPHAGHLQPGIDDRRLNELAWEPEEAFSRNPDRIS